MHDDLHPEIQVDIERDRPAALAFIGRRVFEDGRRPAPYITVTPT